MEEEKLDFPFEGFQHDFDETDLQDFDLKDYLFEPDISKLKDISDFDAETDWIPRIDRFGEFIGDGILFPRLKVSKAVFEGFYEDLNVESSVYLLEEEALSFGSTHSMLISFNEVELPVHVLCYNADVLITKDGKTVQKTDCWIAPLLDMKGYSVQDKFVLQCFELIRLTRVPQKFAEKVKVLSILCASSLHITEENFQIIASSLFFFIEAYFSNKLDDETVDKIEWPIFYGFSKDKVMSYQAEFDMVVRSNDYQRYEQFQRALNEILQNRTDHLQVELNYHQDTFYGVKVFDEYIPLIEGVTDEFFKLYLFGEFVVGLTQVLPEKVLEYYHSTGLNAIERNPSKLILVEDLRLMLITESLLLYDDFIWGPALIFNLLGSICNFINNSQKGLDFLIKSNYFLKNSRDYFLLLYSYLDVITKAGEYEFGMAIIDHAKEFLVEMINEGDILTYSQYTFLSYFSIRFKQNIQISTDVLYILRYLLRIAKQDLSSFPPISYEDEVKGLELIQTFLPEFENDDLKILLQIRSGDIFQILYRTELCSDSPKLDLLLSICEFYLVITKNLNIYSLIYKRQNNYTLFRLRTYFNLFAFYFILKDFEKLEIYKKEFSLEFADVLDSEVFQEFISVLQSDTSFFKFIQKPSNIKKYDIDLSLVYMIKIRSILLEYKSHPDLDTMILQLNEIVENIPDFIQFRPKFYGLQILCKSMLKSNKTYPTLPSIQNKIKEIASEYSIDEELLNLQALTLEDIDMFLSPIKLPFFLNSYV